MLNSWLMQSIFIPAIVTAKIVPVCPSQSLTLAVRCPGKVYPHLKRAQERGWTFRQTSLSSLLSAPQPTCHKNVRCLFQSPFLSELLFRESFCLFKYSSLLLSLDVTGNFTASFHFATVVCTVTVSYPTQWTEKISGTVSYRVFDAHYRLVRARKCLSFEAK